MIDIHTANPKQIDFFRAENRYIAYGGARGGGKSWAVRKKIVLMALNYPWIKMLLLRRTLPDLRENHINELRKDTKGIATYKEMTKIFTFSNGSTLRCGYCAAESDVLQYQGQEYDVIYIDEATQFTEYQFNTLKACVRGTNDFPKRIYLTCNPGNVGHAWVKRLFVDKEYKNGENPEDYKFIPATVDDNKVLMDSDPEYINVLDSLPDGLREAWRYGDWDAMAGQYFSEFDRSIHVCEPFNIPDHWYRYRSIDYGLDCLACVWAAVDTIGNIYIYREYAESDKIISDGALDILKRTGDERIEYTIAPPDLFSRSQESGKSKIELFREAGLDMVKGSNNREAGWLAIKELLRPFRVAEGEKESRLHIFNTCHRLIKYLPMLQINDKRPTDCMTEPHEITHLPDALRYFAVEYDNPPVVKVEESAVSSYKKKILNGNKRKGGWY